MPCDCSHMEAQDFEVELSKVACLLDEIKKGKWEDAHWDGYHPKVYNKATKKLGDKLVSELCGVLRNSDVTNYSLEMQIWWRDHQRADVKRLVREKTKRKKI